MSVTLPFTIDDRYHVVAEIGHGAHAIVYRARDIQLDRDVAVKMLRPDVLEWGVGERFAQEIKITARLDHPHIARVHDTGEWNGRPYFISELATGASLHERLARDGPLPLDEAISIAVDVANALQYAHAAKIVHRDVKPENVLLTSDGALLADFGIARAIGIITEQALTTSTGVAVGTLLYMSPEQICAERNIDGRSDQYSLALVLYEMLTGVRPHDSASVQGLRTLRLAGKQHAPRDHRPSVPQHVNDAVMRALAPAPADRFTSCAEFARALAAPMPAPAPAASRRMPLLVASGVAAIFAAWFVAQAWSSDSSTKPAIARAIGAPVAIAVVTADAAPNTAEGVVASRLRDNLALWSGVRVRHIGDGEPGSAWEKSQHDGINALAIISVRAAPVDSSILVVRERDANGERELLNIRFASDGATDRVVQQLAIRLIGGPAASLDSAPGVETLAETKREALDAYLRAWSTLRRGLLDSAAAFFRASSAVSPRFGAARLWQAQVLQWAYPTDPRLWSIESERTIADIASLSPVDSLLAMGLAALAKSDFPQACAAYRSATQRDATSFAAWYGLGQCQRLDSIVVTDPRSPTGLAFRASPRGALAAYAQALDRIPSPKLGALFGGPARLTFASTQRYRRGRVNTPDGRPVAAFPSVSNDSVVFWPMPLEEILRSDARALPETYLDAIRRGRRAFLSFSDRWVTHATESFSAHIGRALALELDGTLAPNGTGSSGSASAIASLANAKRLAASGADSIDVFLATTRVRLRQQDFAGAARTADSALVGAASRSADLSARLAPLAALTGQARILELLTSRSAQIGDGMTTRLPEWLADRYGAVVAAAALNDCAGLLQKIDSLDRGLSVHFAQSELTAVRMLWLAPTARLAVPCIGENAARMLDHEIQIDRALISWFRREPNARAVFDSIALGRRGANASAIAWNAEFIESWLMTQRGDTTAALARLDSDLRELNGLSEFALTELAPVAGLRHALALAADLAKERSPSSSLRWRGWLRALERDGHRQ